MPVLAKSFFAQSALWLVCLLSFVRPASAQLIRVEAGASDIVPTQGGSISLQGPGYEGYLGVGELAGAFRLGTYAKTTFDSYQVTAGDQNLAFQLPTDLFGGSQYITTRGLGVTLPGESRVFVFAGATTLGAGTPLFQAFQSQTPLGMVFIDKAVSDNFHFYSRNILSQQQTWIQGFDWRPQHWLKTGLSAGAGSNKPYFAASLDATRNWFEVKAGYIQASSGFRRITTPSLFAAEPDRENILVTMKPYSSIVLTAGHENFLAPQDNLNAPFQRASVDQLQSSFDVARFRLGAGLFESRGPSGIRNVADGFTISRSITRNIDASASYYQSLSGPGPRSSYLISTVRENISPKLSLLQVINRTQGNTTFFFGGSYTVNRFSVSVDYQTLYMPFLANPLVTGIGVSLHVKLWGGFQLNGQTFRSPDGKLRYTASGSTLLTPNFRLANNEKQAPKMGDYIVRGHVCDERGSPIGGAAIQIGEQTVFSNEAGEFFLRRVKPEHLAVTVVAQEFLTPLQFTVVAAPPTVTAAPEESATDVVIVLRPVVNHKR